MNYTEKDLSKTVLVAFYSNPEHVQPVVDTIDLLSQEFRVVVVARDVGDFNYKYPDNVTLYKVGPYCERGEYNLPLYKKLFGYLLYTLKLYLLMREEKVSLILLYDLRAFILGCIASRFFREVPLFYHQSTTNLLKDLPKHPFTYLAKYLEFCFCCSVKVMSFQDPVDAKLFLVEAGFKKKNIKKQVIIIENCLRTVVKLPECPPQMQKLKDDGYSIVLHRGPIGGGVDIDTTIRSIKYWPGNAILVLIGFYTSDEEKACREIARQENVIDRLVFIGFVPSYKELLSYTVAGDVGLVLYKVVTALTKYMTPTKLYDYIACGIPVIVPKKMLFISKMVKQYGVGLTYDEATPEAIGRIIRRLLESKERSIMGAKARQLHLTRLNYETQFAPLFDAIKNTIYRN